MEERVKLVSKWIERLESRMQYYYCFLNEKWFFPFSRRKKMKYLLPSVFETEEDAPFSPTKVQSCRFPMKIRYLTIICPPIEGETDGKVLLLEVSHKELTKRAVGHQKFVSNFLLNQGILVNGNESFQIQLTSLLMSFLLQFQNITI